MAYECHAGPLPGPTIASEAVAGLLGLSQDHSAIPHLSWDNVAISGAVGRTATLLPALLIPGRRRWIAIKHPPKMLGRAPVLGGDSIRAMPGHLHRRPAKTRLLLPFGDDCVESRRLEVPKGMEMDVRVHAGIPTRAHKRPAHRVGIRRSSSTGLRREHKSCQSERHTRIVSQKLLCELKITKRLDSPVIEGERSDARPGLRRLHDGASLRRDDRLVDADRVFFPRDVRPTNRTCFAPSDSCRSPVCQADVRHPQEQLFPQGEIGST